MQRRKGENGAIEKKIEETKMSGITQKGIKIYTQKKKQEWKKKWSFVVQWFWCYESVKKGKVEFIFGRNEAYMWKRKKERKGMQRSMSNPWKINMLRMSLAIKQIPVFLP